MIKDSLTEKGYEVLSVWIGNYSANAPFFEWYNIKDDSVCTNPEEKICWSNKVAVSIDVKSLGSRSEQLWDTLTTLGYYPHAFTYRISIKSPTDTCNYLVFGKTYDAFAEEVSLESKSRIDVELEKYKSCS